MESVSNDQIYRFNVGKFRCISVSDGSYDYRPMTFFPGVDEKKLKEVYKNYNINPEKLVSPYTFLYVDTGDHKILADMGAGKLGQNTGRMKANLQNAGINPDQIDTIFITHAHPDHVGGTLDETGSPNYPNAQYYMWKKEWDFWFSDGASADVEKGLSVIVSADVFLKVARGQLEPVKDKIKLLTSEEEIIPGVKIIFTPGHTPGHMIVAFESAGERLYFTGDAIVFPFELQYPQLHPVFDLLPDEAERTRISLCKMLSSENSLILAQHFDPFPGLGYIAGNEDTWKWIPLGKS